MTSNKLFAIGIDPGATIGISMIDEKSKVLDLRSMKWNPSEVINYLQAMGRQFRFVVGVEIPRHILYAKRKGGIKAALDAGKNIGRSETLADFIEIYFTVYRITPTNQPKWDSAYVNRVYGIPKSNEHKRDAIRIAESTLGRYRRDVIVRSQN